MTQKTTDVVIVGAGPTGLTLANLLGTMGVDTMIIERNTSTVDEPRAVSIDDESMRTMQAIGLEAEIQAIVARGYGSHYYSPKRRCFAKVEPLSRDYGFDKRNAFQQPEFEAVLRRGLDRFDCVKSLFGCDVIGFEQNNEGVAVRYSPKSGSSQTILTGFMVASDGGASGIRKALSIPLVGSTFSERWLIIDLEKTWNRFRHTEVYCDPKRPCITLPGPDGIRRYEFMLHRSEDDDAVCEEEFVRKLLDDIGPDREAPLRRVRVYTFHARLAERWRQGRVLLAGDAAHLTPPFAGQGMNSGIRDAHNLGWKLAAALRTSSFDALLDSYETERSPHAWEMIKLAMNMGRIMMPNSHFQAAVVRAGFSLLSLYPPARDYVAQMRYKPKPRFLEGILWPDNRKPGATIVGRLFPQPEVEDTNRQRFMLDKLIGNKPTLIIFAEKPEQAVDAATREGFTRRGIQTVGITPEWMNPASADFPIARDASRLLSAKAFNTYREHAFLLRPDGYVAATVPVKQCSDLEQAARALSFC